MLPPVPEGSASVTRLLASVARLACRLRLRALRVSGSGSLSREVRPTTRIVPDCRVASRSRRSSPILLLGWNPV